MNKGKDFLTIGIDGGASKVAGAVVSIENKDMIGRIEGSVQEIYYNQIPGFLSDFTPLPLPRQLKEREESAIVISAEEYQQGLVIIEAVTWMIEKLVNGTDMPVLLGIGMPGLKSDDLKGMSVVSNGPRVPNFCELLEKRLRLSGIRLAAPIHKLGSDADYCGLGENYTIDGGFRTVQNGYYLGGGTGVADALKLQGRLIPFDRCKTWLAKTWEMADENGISMERYASAAGIAQIYREMKGNAVDEDTFLPQIGEQAMQGDSQARQTLSMVTEKLSLLFYERITTLYCGWQKMFSFVNPMRTPLLPDHTHLKTLLDRIVIGQRLGQFLATKPGERYLLKPVLERLRKRILASPILPEEARAHYQSPERIIYVSTLRNAPIIGAALDAFLNHNRKGAR